MVGTIGVAVRERIDGWLRTSLAFFTAALASGSGLWAALWVVGHFSGPFLTHTARAIVIAAVVMLAVEGWRRRPARCGVHRQVSAAGWPNGPSVTCAAWWGVQLGAGVTTRVNTWALWTGFAILLSQFTGPGPAVVGGMCYGAIRGAQPILELRPNSGETMTRRAQLTSFNFRVPLLIAFVAAAAIATRVPV